MNKYKDFKSVDFINDPRFREWVFNGPSADDPFWEALGSQFSSTKNEMAVAREFLIRLSADKPMVSDEYIHRFGEKVLAQHRNNNGLPQATPDVAYTRSNRRWAYYAAALFITLAGAGWLFTIWQQGNPFVSPGSAHVREGENQISKVNHTGQPQRLLLSDGSTVTLSPKSRLSYPPVFDRDKRTVHLEGEAFFDVKKNPMQPFTVHFADLAVKVLGTSFKIRSYSDEKNISVKVKTGSVSVFKAALPVHSQKTTDPPSKEILLTANQEVNYGKQNEQFERKLSTNPAIVDASLKEKDFIFSETPLDVVFATMEKAYGIKLVFNKNQISSCSLTASLADEPMFEKLNMICKAMNGSYSIIDGQIVMDLKSCKN